MSKTILRSKSFSLVLAIMLLGSFFMISSCGGGGGGGGPTPVTYDGLETQATISSTNANAIFSEVWNGDITSGSAGLGKASSSNFKDSGMVALARQVRDRVSSGFSGSNSISNKVMSTAVDETYHGSTGTLRITGNIDPYTMLGTLTMTFSNFSDGDGVTIDGTVTFRIDGFNQQYDIITDGTMTFTLWTLKAADCDISLTGSIRIQESITSNTETVTINLDGRDNSTKKTFRYENLQFVTIYDNITSAWPVVQSESISGKVYVAEYGYVVISTTNPLTYTPSVQDHPSGGGPMIITGANGSIRITPLSTTQVRIEVDADGDSAYEYSAVYLWSDLSGNPVG